MSKQENKSPAFQLYPKDFLSSEKVDLMNDQELGAYFRLICKCWINDGLPDDEELLAEMVKCDWQEVRAKVLPCFKKHGKRLWNPKLLRIKKEQKENRKKKSEAGKKSARVRKLFKNQAVKSEHVLNSVETEAQHNPTLHTPSPSPTPNNPQTPTGDDCYEGFDEFYEMYPKKVDKKKARDKWKSKKCYLMYGDIITSLGLQITHTWATSEKKFIPSPCVWLNGEKWDDEIIDNRPKEIADQNDEARRREQERVEAVMEQRRKEQQEMVDRKLGRVSQ